MATENEDILVKVEHGVGQVVLNRPKAINSLNAAMVAGLTRALDEWEHDDAVHTVLLTGAGDRGLCAGGDVVAIYHSAQEGGAAARAFWHDEYVLNARIARYPKPYVAVMDGIVMGGGVGVSAHGSHRVVTDTTKLGMPEVGIGFIPDVGGTYLLARTPGLLGVHAALTGAAVSGADAIAMGFADYFVPHDALAEFTAALLADGVVAAVDRHAVEPPPSPLLTHRDWIDEAYSCDTAAGIVAALRALDTEAATKAADLIETRSPIAVSVTLQAIRRAATLDTLEDVLREEFRTSVTALRSHDLVEGIRALLIDKDKNPQWNPATLAQCDSAVVNPYFAPADPDLQLPN